DQPRWSASPWSPLKFGQLPSAKRYKPPPWAPTQSLPLGAASTESTARSFHLSGGESVSILLGLRTAKPPPVPHHKLFSLSSHSEITQSEGKPVERSKCSGGILV